MMSKCLVKFFRWRPFVTVKPSRFSSDKRQISLYNINAFSVREVMRIKDVITQHEFRLVD